MLVRSSRRIFILCALTATALFPHAPLAISSRLAAAPPAAVATEFPRELVAFKPGENNPVFQGAGPGHWDARLAERGWIMRESDGWHLWYTGHDGTPNAIRRLGYATSPDGLKWTRYGDQPLIADHWVEDMMIVKHGDTYFMFAEGLHDEAQWLTSKDRIHWERQGTLDIRYTNGKRLSAGPFGTPTAYLEGGQWYLFYERADLGIWLAKSTDLKTWTNVQDEPVIERGPDEYDKQMLALNQVIKHQGMYYAYYHGTGSQSRPRSWNTDVVRSQDLLHWEKYPGNPLIENNKSSGIVVFDGKQYRLYTMHEQVDVYYPAANGK